MRALTPSLLPKGRGLELRVRKIDRGEIKCSKR